jgi:uncharacterized repeat protein (TIGR01451 family)
MIDALNSVKHRWLWLPALIAAALGWGFGNSASAAIINEPMTGAIAPGWVIGGSAYLTASTGLDPAGDGWLRLTDVSNNQAGFAFFDTPFDISQGVVIQFDYATWGGTGADGYSIYLFDGSYDASTFSVGASGGSLGYDKKTVAPIHAGLTGGYIGVGIDEYGNYSNPTEGRLGGPGQQVNEVGVRGPYNHPSGAYYWLGGSGSLAQSLAFNNQGYRPIQVGSQYRKVIIYLTPVAAPNYLRVDVYLQFGYNQALTPVVTGLMVGRPVPASVKIGYAASTGGSTNYHEIRNLVVDPLQTDINLAITKLASSPAVTAGGPIKYTITARNYGPNNVTANNVPITDTIPALVTGATWTCGNQLNGGTCGAASGTGNINTTATLPFNGSVEYTITGTVSASATPGASITNTASLTVPAGITDYNPNDNSASATVSVTSTPVSISGMVYSDSGAGGGTAHNGVKDGTEGSTNVANIYAKLFRTSDMTTALQAVLVNQAAGTFTFTSVPSYETYTIILSNNATLTDPTPGFPNANWIYTSPLNYTLSNVTVTNSNVTNQNFGMYNGSRISGKVIKDDGLNGALANANDGILNAAETGISGVTVRLTNNTGGTTYDTTTTGSGGDFVLFTNTATATLRIYETNPAGYLSVSYNPGTTGGAYTIGGEYISFAYTLYTDYAGILFGDVPDNTFTPATNSSTTTAPATAYYGHTFTPGSGGSVSFAVNSQTQTWTKAYYLDTNCSGTYDGGDTLITGALTASAGVPICILLQETIPAGAPGVTDNVVTRATFTFTNSVGPVVSTYDVTDSTSVVGAAGAGNKPLYLYDSTSTPAYKLSRTPMTPNAGSYVAIAKGNGVQTWTLDPALQSNVKINSGNIPVYLYLGTNSARTYTPQIDLLCGATVVATENTQPAALTGTAALFPFSLTLAAAYNCAAPTWALRITNTMTGGATARDIRVYPAPAASQYSNVSLPSQNVINVDSVNAYSAAYPAATTPPSGYYSRGNTVYVRAVVSDPFGSYDIDASTPTTLPKITIKDPSGATIVPASGPPPAMTEQVAARTASSKTFEYAYTIPASGPTGTWTASVTAPEGTEGLVSHTANGTFRVALLPSLTVAKTVLTLSDPVNNTTNPKAIPGAVMLYTITVTNSGPGSVDNGTTVITDPLPLNTSMYVSTASGDPVAFTCSATPSCGLTYTYATAVTYSNQAGGGAPYNYTPVPDANGYDANVTGLRINPAATFNGTSGPPNPNFTLTYKIKIN